MRTRTVSGFMLMYSAASLLVSHVVRFKMFLSGADRDCKKGRDPEMWKSKRGPAFSCIEGWVQARLVVITATFTYGGSYTPHPPSAQLGSCTPVVFCKHIPFSPCSRCKRKVFVHSGLLFMSALFAPSSPLQGEGSCTCVLAGVLAPCRAAQWGLIYEPRSSGRYLPALFTIEFSVLRGRPVPRLSPREGLAAWRPWGGLHSPAC